ncbi:MAG TPA: hypothetical protein VJM08_02055 [Anaerolineales bacterium]|nr:hypothetical protein [Anaerolineales bacterium]
MKKFTLISVLSLILVFSAMAQQKQEPAPQKTVGAFQNAADIVIRSEAQLGKGSTVVFEERLILSIPNEYSKPGDYFPEAEFTCDLDKLGIETYCYSVTFTKSGGGWEPIINTDNTKVAYRAKQKGKLFVVVGDRRGPEFDDVRTPVFSPDGSTVAYQAKQNRRWLIVVGDRKGAEFDEVGPPVFSPDGSKVAYGARQNKTSFIILGDQKGREFEQVSSPIFNPNGDTILYVAYQKGKSLLVAGDKIIAEHKVIGDVIFSPDGKKTAYVASDGHRWFMVVEGKQESPFDLVYAPIFSPDGSKIAYIGAKGKNIDKQFIVVKENKGPEFVNISPPIFDQSGNKIAYMAFDHKSKKFISVIGDKTEEVTEPPSDVGYKVVVRSFGRFKINSTIVYKGVEDRNRSLALSPDGSKLAYKAIEDSGEKSLIVIGSQKGPLLDEVWPPVFSPDGTRVGYLARQGRDLWWKVMSVQ